MASKSENGRGFSDWLTDLALRLVIGAMLALPYRWRVPAMGAVMRRIIGPAAGYDRRSLEHLKMIRPELTAGQRRRITQGVLDNMGRTFIENYSTRKFLKRMETAPIEGAGFDALKQAAKEQRPVILVTGHFGNYEAPRAALAGRGFQVGGLYRPARNKFFNTHYARTMHAFGGPVFEQGTRGTAGFVRHLKKGGWLVLLFDQHVSEGTALPFLGRPAATATSAAQLALRYDALLIPFYGIRKENGLDFEIVFESPIPPSDEETMTRAMNSSLEARIAAHPEQWFWVHRRWKIPL